MNSLRWCGVLLIALLALSALSAAAAEKKPWTERIQISGDFRYRHEAISDEKATATGDGHVPDRVRHRFRLRLAAKAEVNPMADAVVRLATGEGDPNSTNQTLTHAFSGKGILIDRAYLDLHPRQWFSARVGKQGVPFEGTDLVWDSDVNLEGIALLPKLADKQGEIGLRLGGFWAQENTTGGGQGMLGGQFVGKKKSDSWSGTLAVGYYNWLHLQNAPLLYSATKSYGNNTISADGARFYLSDFDLLNATASFTLKGARVHTTLSGDVVLNTAAETNPATDEKDDLGWRAGAEFSFSSSPLDWSLGYSYRVLEADATLGVLTDSDHVGGGTNFSGHGISLSLKPMSAVRLGGTLLLDTKDPDHAKLNYQRLQIDLAASF